MYTSCVTAFKPALGADGKSPILSRVCGLVLNQAQVGTDTDSAYYRVVQPFECFQRAPVNGLHMYSFALYPQSGQPSGTCNFSMLTTKMLNIAWDPAVQSLPPGTRAVVSVVAVAINVSRISNGFWQLLE